ncbi:MAG: hypothetical protein IJA39_01180 [Clostridia bacterium]|nr:hypothetical protein [Clostridia bacterium]
MKKIISVFICSLLFLLPLTLSGEALTPRLMVTDYEITEGYLSPEKPSDIKITLKNMNKHISLFNIKVTLLDASGEIRAVDMPSDHIEKIAYGEEYIYEKKLMAVKTASVGEHTLNFTVEYEDGNGIPYTESETIYIDIKQKTELSISGALLPSKAFQGETVNVTISFMNTGKTVLYNCKAEADIKGLTPSGTAFAGTVEAGTAKTAALNFKVGSEETGRVKGKIKITYEDSFGEEYVRTFDIETVIEEKTEASDGSEEDKKVNNSLWWLFILTGIVIGAAAGFGIPFLIKEKKQRKEDDLRL